MDEASEFGFIAVLDLKTDKVKADIMWSIVL